jgi:hypothetical protein
MRMCIESKILFDLADYHENLREYKFLPRNSELIQPENYIHVAPLEIGLLQPMYCAFLIYAS